MNSWNLVILFGVGGGLFLFFSSCFCYYKRKDIIRRRQEKIYEDERDGIYIQPSTKKKIKPLPPNPHQSQSQQQGQSSSSQSTSPDTCSSTVIEMHPVSSPVNSSVINTSSDFENHSSQFSKGQNTSHAQVNPAFDTTEF